MRPGKAEDEASAETRSEAEAAADKAKIDSAAEGLAGGTAICRAVETPTASAKRLEDTRRLSKVVGIQTRRSTPVA